MSEEIISLHACSYPLLPKCIFLGSGRDRNRCIKDCILELNQTLEPEHWIPFRKKWADYSRAYDRFQGQLPASRTQNERQMKVNADFEA